MTSRRLLPWPLAAQRQRITRSCYMGAAATRGTAATGGAAAAGGTANSWGAAATGSGAGRAAVTGGSSGSMIELPTPPLS